jgi:hypothetical protein
MILNKVVYMTGLSFVGNVFWSTFGVANIFVWQPIPIIAKLKATTNYRKIQTIGPTMRFFSSTAQQYTSKDVEFFNST